MNSGIPTGRGEFEPGSAWGGSATREPGAVQSGAEVFGSLRAQLENIASRLDGLASRQPPPPRQDQGPSGMSYRPENGYAEDSGRHAGWQAPAAGSPPDPRLEQLTQSVHQLADRLGMSEQRNADILRQITQRLEELTLRGQAQAMSGDRAGFESALNRIEQRVAELTQRMAAPAGQRGHDATALDRRIDSLARAVDQLGAAQARPADPFDRQLAQPPGAHWQSGADAPADVFAAPVFHQQPSYAQTPQAPSAAPHAPYASAPGERGWRPPAAPFAPWAGARPSPGYADAYPGGPDPNMAYGPPRTDRDALGHAVGDLIRRMDSAERALVHEARSPHNGAHDLERRLEEIGGLLQDTRARIGGLEHLEETFDQMMARVDVAVQQLDHGEQIDALLAQLDQIRATVSQAAESAARNAVQDAAAFSEESARRAAEEAARMAAHETLLSAQDAARAAVLEAIHAFPVPEGRDDQQLINALQQNLQDLRGDMDSTEQRTQATLQAVHETLNAVVRRLSDFDAEGPASHPAHSPGGHAAPYHAYGEAETYQAAEPQPATQHHYEAAAAAAEPEATVSEPPPSRAPEAVPQEQPIHSGAQQQSGAAGAADADLRAYLDQGYGSGRVQPASPQQDFAPEGEAVRSNWIHAQDTGYGPSPHLSGSPVPAGQAHAGAGTTPRGGFAPMDDPEMNRPREPGSGPPPPASEPARPPAQAAEVPQAQPDAAPAYQAMPGAPHFAHAGPNQEGMSAPHPRASLREASTNEELRIAARRAAQAAANQHSLQAAGEAPRTGVLDRLLGGRKRGASDRGQVTPRREPPLSGSQPAAAPAPRAPEGPPAGGGSRGRAVLRSMALAAAAVLLVAGSVRLYSMLGPAPEHTDGAPEKSAAAGSGASAPAPMKEPGDLQGLASSREAVAETAAASGTAPGEPAQTMASAPLDPPAEGDAHMRAGEGRVSGSGPAAQAEQPPPAAPMQLPKGTPATFDPPDAPVGPASLRQAAAKGDPVAQFEVASRYAEGRGVERDLEQAAKWYRNAASLGLAPAQYRIGSMYEKGKGVPKDRETARIWYERAANAGNRTAMHNLAVLHADGVDGKPDFSEAARWFRMAADLDLNDSQYNLAILHVRGMGVPQSFAEAYKWFAILAAKGDKDAASRLDVLAEKLDSNALAAAKLSAQTWKPQTLDADANAVRLPPEGWPDDMSEATAPPGADIIRAAQKLLIERGFDPGPPDGAWGPKTEAALKAFERDAGLGQTGVLTPVLLRRLQAGIERGPSV